MELLIILIVLLPLLKAQSNEPETLFNLTMSSIPELVEPKNQDHEIKDVLETTEQPLKATLFPPIRCLNCSVCFPNEGKTRNSKGKKMCHIRPGILHGCISIFFKYSNAAGGPDGFMVRTCISDLDEDGREYCKNNKKLCEQCFEDDCNYVDINKNGLVTGGGTRIMASILVIFSLTSCLLRNA
ncbi:uncharacterized protein LOC119546351 [Drosophila subpulchrella]|uniref:uncharacterized protein LOC119546351 n=1 Tax=Drosophila subpulchrella TaxID=1486046 RepID=UPI0018A1339D|nr:uncharacterized protein LOC119546351 [Drosophila subpulchrella]